MKRHRERGWDIDNRIRQALVRALGVFVLVQIIAVAIVSIRARMRKLRRIAERPADFPWAPLETIDPLSNTDQITLYMRGSELLNDLIESIDRAERTVYLETFIWNDDASGRAIRDAIERAAHRNVQVRVLYDGVGCINLPQGFLSSSIERFVFKPVSLRLGVIRPSNLLRDHRKLVVIDDEIAYVGGYNFGELYLSWRDTHMRVSGPSVRDLSNVFGDFWNQHRPAGTTPVANVGGRNWDPHLIVHRNDPSLAIFPIRGMYLEAIDRAERHVWMTNAYFVPDRAFRRSLTDASRRGVDVQVILPHHSNHPLTDVLAHGVWDELLSAGVRIFLYRHFMLHAKTCTIDGMWSTVGTANLDRWSMLGNYEINLEIRNDGVAARMERLFRLDKENCIEVDADIWDRRPLLHKVGERTLKSLAPLV